MTNKAKTIDNTWYEQLTAITQETGETFERLMPPDAVLREQRQAFGTSAHTRSPTLLARHLSARALRIQHTRLTDLKKTVASNEPNAHVRTAYMARIDELIHNHDMLLAAQSGDMDAFAAANKKIYGTPDSEIFAAVCAWIRREARAKKAHVVLEFIPDITGNPGVLIPDSHVFDTVRELHNKPDGYYDRVFGKDGLPTETVITQQAGDKICRRILDNLGSDYTIQDSTNGLWSVLPSKKCVTRPAGYTLDRATFIGIVSHEVGTHLLETINGNCQPLRLLTNALAGMNGFEMSGEGRAFLREQIVYESPAEYTTQPSWHYRLAIHLAISLASGLHTAPYDFAATYKVLKELFAFWHDPAPDGSVMSADDMAWNMCVRVFKGTDGHTPYRKDIVYLEGNVGCWHLAQTDPVRIMLGDQGKFDILNPAHILILKELQIIP